MGRRLVVETAMRSFAVVSKPESDRQREDELKRPSLERVSITAGWHRLFLVCICEANAH
jgi:hypothetical protein